MSNSGFNITVNFSWQTLLFRLIYFLLISSLYLYVCHQMTRFTDITYFSTYLVLVFVAFIFTAVLSMPLYFWTRAGRRLTRARRLVLHVAHYSLSYLNFLLPVVVIRDILSFAFYMLSADSYWLYGTSALYWVLFLPVVLAFAGFMPIQRGPYVDFQTIRDSRLPKLFENLKVVQISDLHISMFLQQGLLDRMLKKLSQLKPDLIVMTGDIIDGPVKEHKPEIEKLRGLKAPLGVFYVPGNHEYFWGVEKSLQALRALGFHVLINDAVAIKRGDEEFLVAGVPDPAARLFRKEPENFEKLDKHLKDKQFRLLLSHTPDLAEPANKKGYHLQLSGHTHGGQFFPWNLLIYLFHKHNRGLYKVGDLNLYVNQGTGYWGPALRLGTHCEITELSLVRKA